MKKILQQVKENMIADRLKLSADKIRSERKVPDTEICDAIGDATWFREYCNLCLQQPIANSFLGCILFGWQLCEEFKGLNDRDVVPKVYRP